MSTHGPQLQDAALQDTTNAFELAERKSQHVKEVTAKDSVAASKTQETTYGLDSHSESDLEADAGSDFDSDQDDGNIPDLYPDGGWKAYSVVLGSFLCCLTAFGLMNTLGVMESYIQNHQLETSSVSTVSWIFSIFMFISLFPGLFIGPLYDVVGSRWLLLTGTIFIFVGLMTMAVSTEVYQFILSFGICDGIGAAFMMFPSVSSVSSWFSKKKRSFALGLAMAGGSFGGVVFPIMLRALFPRYGFVWSIRILALLNLGISSVGSFLASDRLKQIRLKTKDVDSGTFWDKLKDSFDIKAFKDKKFALLSCGVMLNEFALLITLTYIASYAMIEGVSQAESYQMLTILNLSGVFGRFVPNYVAGYYGSFNVIIVMSTLNTFCLFVIWLPFGKFKGALYMFIVIFGFTCAATYSLVGATVSTITRKTKDFGKHYGTVYAFVSFGNLLSLPVAGALIKHKTATDYNKMIIFAACTCVAATAFFILSRISIVGRKVRVVV